jgi:hypothetical protein
MDRESELASRPMDASGSTRPLLVPPSRSHSSSSSSGPDTMGEGVERPRWCGLKRLSLRRGLPPPAPSTGRGEWERDDEAWLDAVRYESRRCGESMPLICVSADAVWERQSGWQSAPASATRGWPTTARTQSKASDSGVKMDVAVSRTRPGPRCSPGSPPATHQSTETVWESLATAGALRESPESGRTYWGGVRRDDRDGLVARSRWAERRRVLRPCSRVEGRARWAAGGIVNRLGSRSASCC